jgi:hypothetical protein
LRIYRSDLINAAQLTLHRVAPVVFPVSFVQFELLIFANQSDQNEYAVRTPALISLKKDVDSKEIKMNLISDNGFPYNGKIKSVELPRKLTPKGLSAERQWYLYNQIRMHIPNVKDKDRTCPKPDVSKPTE